MAALLLYELCYSRQLGTPEAFTLSSLFLRFSIPGLDFFFCSFFTAERPPPDLPTWLDSGRRTGWEQG